MASKLNKDIAQNFLSKNFDNVENNKIGTSIENPKENKIETKNNNVNLKSDNVKIHKTYYVTEEQSKKIKLLAINKKTDTSALVREAINDLFTKYDI